MDTAISASRNDSSAKIKTSGVPIDTESEQTDFAQNVRNGLSPLSIPRIVANKNIASSILGYLGLFVFVKLECISTRALLQ